MGSFELWNPKLVDFITMMDRDQGEGKGNPLASRLFGEKCCSKLHTMCKLACIAGVFFGWTKVFTHESAMLKLQKRGGNGASPRSSFIKKSKMVTTKIRRYKPSFHPPKICLHCRQQLQVYVCVNPIIFWPSLKKKKRKKNYAPFLS